MKKNRFIKLASGLLVLCLMTTCVIGATLAKYTTATDTQDSARVAKWGVRISAAANSAFKTEKLAFSLVTARHRAFVVFAALL